MGLIADLKNKSQDIPLPGLLKERLEILKRIEKIPDSERDGLLAKLEILTASDSKLSQIIDINADKPSEPPSESELEVLSFVATQMESSAREVADALGCDLATAEDRLTQLVKKDCLVDSQLLGRHSYLANQRGRDYIANATETG